MSPQPRGIRFRGPQQQRGAIGLMAAVTLGMVLLFMLLVVDSGRLYFEQRKLQRIADVAVLEAVSRGGSCLTTPKTAQTYANDSATRNGFTPAGTQTLGITCGTLETRDSLRTFVADDTKSDAIRVIATTVVPSSVAGGLWELFSNGSFKLDTHLTASAVGATQGPTLAQISIRTTLLTVDTKKSLLLNGLFKNLLGGDLSISAVGWEGLINADINLLQYLDQLAINLKLTAGDYTKLLSTDAKVTQLIQAAIDIAEVNGSTAEVKTALASLKLAAINDPAIKIGDLLKLQTGSTSSGLDANVQLFQLLQAFIQVANKNHAVAIALPINIPGLLNLTTQISIIEPPQFSAIGNPALALNAKPEDANAIYVRTAQIRTLISIQLPILNTLTGLLNAVQGLLSPLTSILNGLGCLFGSCEKVEIELLNSPTIHVSLDAGGANALLTGYNCSSSNKSLTVKAESSIATLRIGKIPTPADVFTSKTFKVEALPLVNFVSTECKSGKCTRRDFGAGGVALSVSTYIAKTVHSDLVFSGIYAPPNLKLPPAEQHMIPTEKIIDSLKTTLAGISIELYGPANSTGVLDTLASGITGGLNTALNLVLNIILPLVVNILSGILDPIIDGLLSLLGINLMDTTIGANLSCGQGGRAQLIL